MRVAQSGRKEVMRKHRGRQGCGEGGSSGRRAGATMEHYHRVLVKEIRRGHTRYRLDLPHPLTEAHSTDL